ncbi:unnamed protein product [Clonostachys rhizophaga]|uniref:Uncharacterized protein n=1 Tax=Clonostachys rhizophaga TaxID=160324 RepID=A0A9N9V011_9HYPO|nr:unnamed protein product [Clonostachys rhizophaga]
MSISVSENRPGPSVSDTSSRCVQPSSTTYSTYSQELIGHKPLSRRNSNTTLQSRPSSPTPPARQDDDHLAPSFIANGDPLFLSTASPGQDAPYHNINQDKVNLKHALEDLARQPPNGNTNGHSADGGGDGHNSNKRPRRDDPSSQSSPAKATTASITTRRNGLKDVEGSSVKDAKARKTS